jgi:hypothetical protein
VDNTSDLNKPISTLTQTALNAKEDLSNKSTAITLGTSNDFYPSQNAVKVYVDNATSTAVLTNATGLPLATGVTGILPVANGGTGASTQNFVDLSTNQTIAGIKTFSSPIAGSINGNAATATKFVTPRTINGVPFDGSAPITITADAGTLTGNTLASNVVNSSLTSVGPLTNLTVTNPIAGSVTGSSGSTTGNAATASLAAEATKLATPRAINGVAFDGTAPITVTADAGTLTGNTLAPNVVNSSLTSVGPLTNLTVTNTIVGSVNGNAATANLAANATKLATPRAINGVAFDGTAPITVTADAGTLTGNTLASNVVNSSLTSVGTITNGTWNGTPIAVANGGTGLTAAGTKGQVLTSTGTGLAWSVTYSLGFHAELGGYVFYVTPDGNHGLVAATQDHGTGTNWFSAQDVISNPFFHNADGKKFTDWRLPTKYELELMEDYKTQIGGFDTSTIYWSSTERFNSSRAWAVDFANGSPDDEDKANTISKVRAVRSF